ncbi:MAG: hypothetical protein JO197_22930 [Acidobacteria bacterium]|nr:hypothetical protein [Acidobacteriota bacterium]MBV9477938.1 hypothetical protein [Acidobacteriota bacterium]
MADKWVWAPVACVALLAIAFACMSKFVPAPTPHPPKKPVLALEVPASDAEVAALLATKDAQASALANTRWDYWFIAAYTLLFLAMAWQQRDLGLRIAAMVLALAAAAFDVWEDLIIERFIRAPDHAHASEVWFPAQAKWFCIFAGVALTALLFARLGRWWWIAFAIVLIVPALVGAAAAIARIRPLLELTIDPTMELFALAALVWPFAAKLARAIRPAA